MGVKKEILTMSCNTPLTAPTQSPRTETHVEDAAEWDALLNNLGVLMVKASNNEMSILVPSMSWSVLAWKTFGSFQTGWTV